MKASGRLAKSIPLALAIGLAGLALSYAQQPSGTQTGYQAPDCPYQKPGEPPQKGPYCHPYPQPRPEASEQTTTGCQPEDPQCQTCPDCLTKVDTGKGIFPASNPFNYKTFPGTNFLPNVYTDNFDGLGERIPNTLPSTPDIPYNLHDGEPVVTDINELSPTDDLRTLFGVIQRKAAEVIRLEKDKLEDKGEAGDKWTGLDQEELEFAQKAVKDAIQRCLDILEGNPVPYRAYSGIPLLHYVGPEKIKQVTPVRDGGGAIVGGNVDVHQIWYGQHIESDAAFIDPTPILNLTDEDGNPRDVEWTVTYAVDVLRRGHDDFSPFVTYTDNPAASSYLNSNTGQPCTPGTSDCVQQSPMPNVGMDQTFFNMEDGTRTVFKIKMAPPKYLNLVYTWGWRSHPPRIQVMEKATKPINYGFDYSSGTKQTKTHPGCPGVYNGLKLPKIEQAVFCMPDSRESPWWNSTPLQSNGPPPTCTSVRCKPGQEDSQCRERQLYAIGRIGDLSPAKRMWKELGEAKAAAAVNDYKKVEEIAIRLTESRPTDSGNTTIPAFWSWLDRTQLPCFERDAQGNCVVGVEEDPDADITILYVNNTIYGQLTDGAWIRWDKWKERPATLKVTAYNSDYFAHSYVIADFGGDRGWENQFKSSVKVAGSGCWFTFGRAYWWLSAGGRPNGFLCVPQASAPNAPGRHRFEVTFNYDPSRRLRFYQFDPFHHDVAIYSIH